MSAGFTTCGGDHLAKKSELSRTRRLLGAYRDLLVVEDAEIDAERLTATLHVLFGYETEIRCASTIGDALNSIQQQVPGIVFLDDILMPSVTASQSIPLLRGAGYTGPIIVISGQVTHSRRSSLLSGGASDVIHKDDIDSVRVAEAVSRLPAPGPDGAS